MMCDSDPIAILISHVVKRFCIIFYHHFHSLFLLPDASLFSAGIFGLFNSSRDVPDEELLHAKQAKSFSRLAPLRSKFWDRQNG